MLVAYPRNCCGSTHRMGTVFDVTGIIEDFGQCGSCLRVMKERVALTGETENSGKIIVGVPTYRLIKLPGVDPQAETITEEEAEVR